MADLEASEHCDRVGEQAQFAQMVSLQATQRFLVICDKKGNGKSSLMRRLQHNCYYGREGVQRVPSSLIDLKTLDGKLSLFDVVDRLVQGFEVRGEDPKDLFTSYNSFFHALENKDFGPFEAGATGVPGIVARGAVSVPGVVSAEGSASAGVLTGGLAAGVNLTIDAPNASEIRFAQAPPAPDRPDFSPGQLKRAQDRCVRAFFEDLAMICADRPMVILLDTWEGCNVEVRAKIFDDLLGNHIFHPEPARRPQKLTLVIAGQPRETHQFGLRADDFRVLFNSDAEFTANVHPIARLSQDWESGYVRDFMRRHAYKNLEPSATDVEAIKEHLHQGVPLEKLIKAIKGLYEVAQYAALDAGAS